MTPGSSTPSNNTAIIELNDSGVRLLQAGVSHAESPGYALISDRALVLGEPARQQARLHPLQTNNQYWRQLNLDPLRNANALCRHHADLAYNHLKEIQQLSDNLREVIFAIPGHFSREQLSLLLGIVQACDFTAVGMVDSATAALAPQVGPGEYLHLDIQLHQTVVTQVSADQALVRQQVEVIPATGMVALYDAWAQLAASQFIQQTRFDPLHNASTEQELYDQLPEFLNQCQHLGEAKLTVGKHNISLSSDVLRHQVADIYQRIAQKLQRPDQQIYLSHRWGKLPGFQQCLGELGLQHSILLGEDSLAAGCHLHERNIRGSGENLNFITSLPVTATPAQPGPQSTSQVQQPATKLTLASHLLCGHQAYPTNQRLYIINDGGLSLSQSPNGHCIGEVDAKDGQLALSAINGSGLQINNRPAHNGDTLAAGDQIRVPGSDAAITAISVIAPHGT